MMRRIALSLIACAALPMAVCAQAPSAERLTMARALVAQMVTDQSIARTFSGLDKMMSSQMMTAMVPAGDLERARAADPYLDERLKRVTKVTSDYVRGLMTELMPQLREAMASSFAGQLTSEDLAADLVFARTPAGQRLFASFYNVMQDPGYAAFMQSFVKRMVDGRSVLIEKITAATADLPAPKLAK